MKLFLFIFSWIFFLGISAQPNLVRNGNFESYVACPIISSVKNDFCAVDSNNNVDNWFQFGATNYFATYLNICANPYPYHPNTGASMYKTGIPQNNYGYQDARSGNGYIGITITKFDVKNNTIDDYSGYYNGYLGTRLKDNCINRLNYFAQGFLSASGLDNYLNTNKSLFSDPEVYGYYTTSNIGILLASSIPNLKNDRRVEMSVQINNPPNKNLGDTINWMEVSGTFEANGSEKFLFIGNFSDSADIRFYNSYGYTEPMSRRWVIYCDYYIDDVSLIPQNTTHFYDSILCSNAPLQLGAVSQADSFEWHDGNKTDKLRHFNKPGLVWVKSWLYGGTVYMWDSINIINQPISTGLPKDTFFCFNQPYLTLTATANNGYLWHNGSKLNSLLIDRLDLLSGNLKVWLTVTKNTCTLTDTVSITQKPAIQIPITDTTTCFEDVPQILLDAGAKFKTYLWQPTGETTKTVYSQQAQIYNLTVTDSFNCTQTKSIAVDELCKAEVFIPNAFTPNSDNLNDTYKPIFKTKNLLQYEFKIFDSWGNEVFTTTDPTKAWDAKNSSVGVYVVLVNYQYKGFLPQTQKGTVTLLR